MRSPRHAIRRRLALRRRVWLLPLLLLSVLVLSLTAMYFMWMQQQARAAFEAHRWELPSRVYARPLELFAGAQQTLAQVNAELDRLGYQHRDPLAGSGEYQLRGQSLWLHTRGFQFADGAEMPRQLLITFADETITQISDRVTHENVPIIRLEPVEIAKFHAAQQEDRVLVRLREVPQALIQAVVAVEDQSFYRHRGIDIFGMLRALLVDLWHWELKQGGSTITQQLVKNWVVGSERSIRRKLKEIPMAIAIDRHYSKDEILESYLNEVYLGQDGDRAIHGVGLGAEFYFGRPLPELSLAQLALLAGLPRGASHYDPRRHPARALQRRNIILKVMAEQGYISAAQAEYAQAEDLGVLPAPLLRQTPYRSFVELLRQQLQSDYRAEDLRSAGLQIFTTLNTALQAQTDAALQAQLAALENHQTRPPMSLQGAVIIASADGGEILALAGGRDPAHVGFNRALHARRQVGSLLKPAIYLRALKQPYRYNVTSLIEDAPITVPMQGRDWSPENYDGKSHGAVPLYSALAQSYNLASVRLGMEIGVAEVAAELTALGLPAGLPPYPSLLLGAVELTPLQVLQMYQTLAGKGFRAPLTSIHMVTDSRGQALTRYGLQVTQAADPAAVYLTTYLLTQATRAGTAAALAKLLDSAALIAGKTGTTNDQRDSWFAGFGADRVAVAWVGRDDNLPVALTGASGAMRVWAAAMRGAAGLQLDAPPAEIEWRYIDRHSGQRTDANCASADLFPFMRASEPLTIMPCSSAVRALP